MATDPFALVTDDDIKLLQLALQLGCGRSKPALAKRRQYWFCYMGRILQIEANNRGLPVPPLQSHAGDLPPGPLPA